jgi:hypothetical protein
MVADNNHKKMRSLQVQLQNRYSGGDKMIAAAAAHSRSNE